MSDGVLITFIIVAGALGIGFLAICGVVLIGLGVAALAALSPTKPLPSIDDTDGTAAGGKGILPASGA